MLAGDAATEVFIGGWVDGWRTSLAQQPSVYAATCSIGTSGGLAVQREGPVVIGSSHPTAAAALARDIATAGRDVMNVVGKAEACESFARAWSDLTGCEWRLVMRLRHHVLIEPKDVAIAPGAMRPADSADLPWLLEHALRFAHEAGLPDSPRMVEMSVARRFARNGFRIWTDHVAVAFAGCVDVRSDARIGMVYTVPQHRRHGYGSSLVSSLVRERRAAGIRRLFLTTDMANPTSNAVYARVGFQPLEQEVRLDFSPAPRTR